MTKQRKLILDVMKNGYTHKCAEDIYMAAKKKMPAIVMATVYNNLNHLCSAGEIKRIKIPGEPDRFDITTKSHEHLICRSCGELKDAWIEENDLLNELRSKLNNNSVDGYELTLYYICDICKAKAAPDN